MKPCLHGEHADHGLDDAGGAQRVAGLPLVELHGVAVPKSAVTALSSAASPLASRCRAG